MSLDKVDAGKNPPENINVVIEIPMNGEPVKYEVDKDSGAIFVDRLLSTAMHYPCNYGYMPDSLCGDGDPLDALVLFPHALPPGSVIRCRPLGVLNMTDESGEDAKLLVVPVDKVTTLYSQVKSVDDLPELTLAQISHFFERYKDLEPGKWVKVEGWGGVEAAHKEITNAIANYGNSDS